MKSLKSHTLLAACLALAGCTANSGTGAESGAKSDSAAPSPTAAPSADSVAAAVANDPAEILAVGTPAPAFDVVDDEGVRHRLADLKGKKNVVLIFYPMNETPGCTKQLCAARDAWADYQAADVQVFGVNPASVKSHKEFADNHNFPFPLLADEEKAIVRAYGCEGLMTTKRTVYGISKEGTIVFAERGMPDTKAILAAFQ